MSATNQNPQQLSYQDAANAMRDQVYSPVFFSKLSKDYGIQPADQEEAQILLALAEQLREAQGQEAVKSASQRKSLLKEAYSDLNKAMGRPGLNNTSPNLREDQVKAAASQCLTQQPALKDAALLMRDYLAQMAAQQA